MLFWSFSIIASLLRYLPRGTSFPGNKLKKSWPLVPPSHSLKNCPIKNGGPPPGSLIIVTSPLHYIVKVWSSSNGSLWPSSRGSLKNVWPSPGGSSKKVLLSDPLYLIKQATFPYFLPPCTQNSLPRLCMHVNFATGALPHRYVLHTNRNCEPLAVTQYTHGAGWLSTKAQKCHWVALNEWVLSRKIVIYGND